MFCKKCGNEYRDDYDYCINCGEPNPLRQKQEEKAPVNNMQTAAANSQISREDLERNMSLWSVIAFVVAICGPIIIDLIFANIANSRIITYKETYGALREALLTNERLAKAARIIGIVKIISFGVFIVVYFFYFFFLGIMMGLADSGIF